MGTLVTDFPDLPLPRKLFRTPYKERGLEVTGIVLLNADRPVAGAADAPWGRKMYIAISSSQQHQLGIQKPSNHMAALIDKKTGITNFYILTALAPDKDFIERAEQGLYAYCGITNRQQAEQIVNDHPLGQDTSIGAPFFKHEFLNSTTEFAILDIGKMQGKPIQTVLPIQNDLQKYPASQRQEWEKQNTSSLPLVVVPSPIAKLLGNGMARSTLQPEFLGKTVASGTTCQLNIEGQTTEVLIVGSLDHVYIDPRLKEALGENMSTQMLELTVLVGQRSLKISPVRSVQTLREDQAQAVSGVLKKVKPVL